MWGSARVLWRRQTPCNTGEKPIGIGRGYGVQGMRTRSNNDHRSKTRRRLSMAAAILLSLVLAGNGAPAFAATVSFTWRTTGDFARNAGTTGETTRRTWIDTWTEPEGVSYETPHHVTEVAAGYEHSVWLRANGTVVAMGGNDWGQCNVSDWADIVHIGAGYPVTLGIRPDRTVIAAGANVVGECEVSGWTDIVQVDAGHWHSIGLRSDGTVVATGMDLDGQCQVHGWTDIVEVAAGSYHTVGLRSDGTVVAVGRNDYGQCDVSGWTDVVAIGAGYCHTVGLRSDGTVLAVGNNDYGQCEVGEWSDVVTLGSGYAATLGRRADGTVLAAGAPTYGQLDVRSWHGVSGLDGGGWNSLALMPDGTPLAIGWNRDGQSDVGTVAVIGGIGRSVGLRLDTTRAITPIRLTFGSSPLKYGQAVKFGVRSSTDGGSWGEIMGGDGRPIDWSWGGSYLGRDRRDFEPTTRITGVGPTENLDITVRIESAGDAPLTLGRVTLDAYVPPSLERLAGSTRYGTAIAACRGVFDAAGTVVLATGAGYADALAASGLAGAYDAPLLLTARTGLPREVRDEIVRLGARRVIIVGGDAAIGEAVETDLAQLPKLKVERIAGADRYATAAEVARRIAKETKRSFSGRAFVVRGDRFADALALSPLAYATSSPILLTRAETLAEPTRGAIAGLGITRIVIAGGFGAVSERVEAELASIKGVTTPERVAGADRYATAAAIASYGVAQGWVSRKVVAFATGGEYADGLCGGATAGAAGGVLLLTANATLPPASCAWIAENRNEVDEVDVLGGERAVRRSALTALEAALE